MSEFEQDINEINSENTTVVDFAEKSPYESGGEETKIVQVEVINAQVDDKNDNTFCTAAAILGVVGFILNPVYLVSILAIIFGAIYCKKPCKRAELANIGILLGVVGIASQLYLDFYITMITGGVGFFSFCC